jgi:hypothetical protein
MRRIEMLNEDEGEATARRQRGKQFRAGFKAAGGCADADYGKAAFHTWQLARAIHRHRIGLFLGIYF